MERIILTTQNANKDPSYTEMVVGPGSLPLPTVKERTCSSSDSYCPIGTSQESLNGDRKPEKVFSYILDDTVSEEFPKRSYSVGSRPVPKESLTQRVLSTESLKSTGLTDKNREGNKCDNHSSDFVEIDFNRPRGGSESNGSRPRTSSFRKQFIRGHSPRSSYGHATTLSGRNQPEGSNSVNFSNRSVKSGESNDFVELDFYRPRAVSDCNSSRRRTFSLKKQFSQGHRPRSSSYEHATAVRQLRSEGLQTGKGNENNVKFEGKKVETVKSKTKHEDKCKDNFCEPKENNGNLQKEQRQIVIDKSHNKLCMNEYSKGRHVDKLNIKHVTKVILEHSAVQDDGYCDLNIKYSNKTDL